MNEKAMPITVIVFFCVVKFLCYKNFYFIKMDLLFVLRYTIIR